ncbi:MAG TPA: helix-turn-helix transcriptional regulator [Verrucomicrobiae bacterium]|nr:helix-turn-helix transcriptional regulator [Verrucomicrobiae bacterium]
MSPEARAASEAATKKMLREMELRDIRKARKITQAKLAKRLKIGQDAVSKIERRADMYFSTLADVIHAAGAQLQVIARFPDGESYLVKMGKGRKRK